MGITDSIIAIVFVGALVIGGVLYIYLEYIKPLIKKINQGEKQNGNN